MKNDKLERMLDLAKQQEALEVHHIPEEVESKLQDIYQAIEQKQSVQQIRETLPLSSQTPAVIEKMTPSSVRTKSNRIKRYGITVAAALIITVGGIIGSGYVSPDMASLIKQVPGTNQIYQFTSTFGWTPADELQSVIPLTSVTQDGVTLTLSYLIYDGKKIYVHLQQQSKTELHDYQAIHLSINGKLLPSANHDDSNLQWSENKDQNTSEISWQKELTSDMIPAQSGILDSLEEKGSNSEPSQELDVQLKIQLQDMPDQPFTFNVHVQRDIPQTYLLKESVKTKEGIMYNQVKATGTSASTFIELKASGIEKWRDQYYKQYGHYPSSMDYILSDSMNNVYRIQSRSGNFDNETLEYHALPKATQEITLIPWRFNEEPILKNYRFSNELNLTNSPALIDMGQTGKVNVLKIESTPEKYILHIQPQEAYQAYMLAYSFWYGQLDQDRHETYPSEVILDPEGQFLVSFEKSKLKPNDQLYYSANKMHYLEPIHMELINQ